MDHDSLALYQHQIFIRISIHLNPGGSGYGGCTVFVFRSSDSWPSRKVPSVQSHCGFHPLPQGFAASIFAPLWGFALNLLVASTNVHGIFFRISTEPTSVMKRGHSLQPFRTPQMSAAADAFGTRTLLRTCKSTCKTSARLMWIHSRVYEIFCSKFWWGRGALHRDVPYVSCSNGVDCRTVPLNLWCRFQVIPQKSKAGIALCLSLYSVCAASCKS